MHLKVSTSAAAVLFFIPYSDSHAFLHQHCKLNNIFHVNNKTEPSRLADVAICPGYTGLGASEGVPFDFNLIIGNGIDVDLPTDDVIMEDTQQGVCKLSPDMKSLILLGGSLVQRSLLGSSLQWKSICGLARGTLLKVRLKYSARCDSNSEILTDTDDIDMLQEEAMNNMITDVDSIKK